MYVSVYLIVFFFFFFKQKTAYEMRISDWSSDVCSSDRRWASTALGNGSISANHTASRPRGCQARLAASMPLHTLPYSSGAAWGAPREVRGCGFMSGLLFVWPWTVWPGRDVDWQAQGGEGRVAFGSGGRAHTRESGKAWLGATVG